MTDTIDVKEILAKSQQKNAVIQQQAAETLVNPKERVTRYARETLGIVRQTSTRKPIITARRAKNVRNANGFNIVIWGSEKVGKTHFGFTSGQFEGIKDPQVAGKYRLPPGYPVCLIDAHFGAAPVTENPIFSQLMQENDPSGLKVKAHDWTLNDDNEPVLEEVKIPLGKAMISQPNIGETEYEENPMQLVQWFNDQVSFYSSILNRLGRGTIVIDSWTNIQKAWNAIVSLAVGKDTIGKVRNPDLKDSESKVPQYWWTTRNHNMEAIVKKILSAKGHSVYIVNEGTPFLINDKQKAEYIPRDPDTPNAEPKCFNQLMYLTDVAAHARADPLTDERFCKITNSRYNIQEVRNKVIYDATFQKAIDNWYFAIQQGKEKESMVGSEAIDKLHAARARKKQPNKEAKQKDSFAI